MFRTTRNVKETRNSHVSHVVLDSKWESSVAYRFEQLGFVEAYVRNDHLDFTVPYEFEGRSHDFIPDYIRSSTPPRGRAPRNASHRRASVHCCPPPPPAWS